jgi:hypothetical protein
VIVISWNFVFGWQIETLPVQPNPVVQLLTGPQTQQSNPFHLNPLPAFHNSHPQQCFKKLVTKTLAIHCFIFNCVFASFVTNEMKFDLLCGIL